MCGNYTLEHPPTPSGPLPASWLPKNRTAWIQKTGPELIHIRRVTEPESIGGLGTPRLEARLLGATVYLYRKKP